jgi:hypothetical protein
MARHLQAMATVAMPIGTAEDLRVQALQRLYRRREMVDELIQTLELYQEAERPRKAACVPISAGRGWLS